MIHKSNIFSPVAGLCPCYALNFLRINFVLLIWTLVFIDEPEKQIILKNCWSGPITNKLILIFKMLHFFYKIKKNTCGYHYESIDDMIYSSWDKEQNILKLVILGHFLPFYPPPSKNPKNQNFEKWKNLLKIYHFTHEYQKSQSYDVRSDGFRGCVRGACTP